jgi:DNA-nicking Smr family endonuclease
MGNAFKSSKDGNISTLPYESSSSSQSDALIEANSLRQKADQLQSQSTQVSKQSQWEYQHGSKSEAKKLSDQKKTLYNEMNQKRIQAADLIFQHYNRNRPVDAIDLHGLYVAEALEYLQRKIDECRIKNISTLQVIAGMGNHSTDNIAKIKPKVEEFARRNHLDITPFPGYVVLNLTQNKQSQLPTTHQNKDRCIIL